MTKNTYILDTNVLLSDSNSLFGFKEHNVVLPLIVLEELDRHKDRQDEVGRNARDFVRKLSELTKENQDFKKGISIGNNMGTLRILAISDLMQESEAIEQLPFELQDKKTGDNTIAQFCVNYIHTHKDETVVLITRDTILRLKAKALGVVVEDYKKFNVVTSVSALFSGVEMLEDVDGVDVNDFYECGDAGYVLPKEIEERLYPNQFVIIKNGQQSGVARFIAPGKPLRKMAKNPGKLSPRNKEQEFARELLFDNDVKLVTLAGQAGTGKAQSLDSKVLTPAGWTTMGQIKVGSSVVARNGKPTKVTGVFPQGEKDIYKVTFSDRSSTECCEDHLWYTWSARERDSKRNGTVRALKDIIPTLRLNSGKRNYSIPMVSPVEFEQRAVPVEPYLLGALLGDGHFGSTGFVGFTSADEELVAELETLLPTTNTFKKKANSKYDYSVIDKRTIGERSGAALRSKLRSPTGIEHNMYSPVQFAAEHGLSVSGLHRLRTGKFAALRGWTLVDNFESKQVAGYRRTELSTALHSLNLLGCKSFEKFVPEQYKYNTVATRVGVLQGLMDTDGFVGKDGTTVAFYSTSRILAGDVQELVRSLGGKATINNKQTQFTYKGVKKDGLPSFVVNISMPASINPFRLTRKASRYIPRTKYQPARFIESVELVGRKPAQCISVEDSEHLYVTDDYIVTHNTLLSIDAGIEQVLNGKRYRSLVICRPVMPVGRDIGFLPGDLNEKLEPWLAPIKDNLRFLLSEFGKKSKFDEQVLQSYFEEGIIEVQAMTFIRGRSIANAFVIIDEAQNTNLHEMKTILTRVGENTKIVLTGDIEQIDNTYVDSVSNGLSIAIERFKSQPIAGHVTFKKGERSQLATIAAEILR